MFDEQISRLVPEHAESIADMIRRPLVKLPSIGAKQRGPRVRWSLRRPRTEHPRPCLVVHTAAQLNMWVIARQLVRVA